MQKFFIDVKQVQVPGTMRFRVVGMGHALKIKSKHIRYKMITVPTWENMFFFFVQ